MRESKKKAVLPEKIEPLFVSAVFSTFYAFRTTHLLPKKKKAKNEKKANVKNEIPKIIVEILSNQKNFVNMLLFIEFHPAHMHLTTAILHLARNHIVDSTIHPYYENRC